MTSVKCDEGAAASQQFDIWLVFREKDRRCVINRDGNETCYKVAVERDRRQPFIWTRLFRQKRERDRQKDRQKKAVYIYKLQANYNTPHKWP